MARHLPFDRREDPAPPRRAGGPQEQLHHPRRRRPDPPAQAAAGSREHRREALAGARAGRPHRQLEEPRTDPRAGAGRRGGELRRRQGQEALHRLSGSAEGAQRRRLRRPAAGMHPAVPRAARGAAPVPVAVSVHSGRRVSGHQRRAISLAAALGAEHDERGHILRCHSGARRRREPGIHNPRRWLWIPGSLAPLGPRNDSREIDANCPHLCCGPPGASSRPSSAFNICMPRTFSISS